ncbi:MAG: tetratricopeptide repeat protein [Dehalococcoidia bacterium]
MSTGEITEATSMANVKRGGGRFLDSGLNRMIIWSVALLVVSVLGFAVYYYVDQSGSGDSGLAARELAVAEQAVRDDPTNITNRLVLADLYYARQNYEDAATQYQEALAINDKTTLGHVGLGRALMGTGDLAGAAENFQVVIDLSKEEDISGKLVQSSYYYLGSIALEQENPEEAVKNLKQATALERSDADAWYLLGTAYLQSGNLDEAINTLGQAILFVPNFTEAYETLADAFDQKGEAAGALYARGMAAYSNGDLGDAADKLETAIAAAPKFAEAHAGLGLVRESQGQKDAAIVAYQEALQLKPDNFLASNGLARLIGASSGTDLPANHPTAAAGEGSEQGVTP